MGETGLSKGVWRLMYFLLVLGVLQLVVLLVVLAAVLEGTDEVVDFEDTEAKSVVELDLLLTASLDSSFLLNMFIVFYATLSCPFLLGGSVPNTYLPG